MLVASTEILTPLMLEVIKEHNSNATWMFLGHQQFTLLAIGVFVTLENISICHT